MYIKVKPLFKVKISSSYLVNSDWLGKGWGPGISILTYHANYDLSNIQTHFEKHWKENIGLQTPNDIHKTEALLFFFSHREQDNWRQQAVLSWRVEAQNQKSRSASFKSLRYFHCLRIPENLMSLEPHLVIRWSILPAFAGILTASTLGTKQEL